MSIINTENLIKKFKDLLAVDNVNLEIDEGECFGLLGPNGAGKTSLIRMLIAVSPPTSGVIRILGNDLKAYSRQVKAVMGVIPQLDNLDPDLTVIQNLATFARYFDISRSEASRRSIELLTLFELKNKRNSRISELSGGMKRRLLIARGLINSPKILVLDEPTIGLDPQARHLVWQKLIELKFQGITQLLCTQNMEEAVLLCDRVAIMHQGKILTVGVPQNLISHYVGREVWEIDLKPDEVNKAVSDIKNKGLNFELVGTKISIFGHIIEDSVRGIVEPQERLKRRSATLEDVFFLLTGRSLSE